jgi:hypothetical protein
MPIIWCYHELLSVLELLSLRRPLGDKKIVLLLYNLTMWGSYTSHFVEIQQTWFVYPYRKLAPRSPFRALPIMLGTDNLLWLHNIAMWWSKMHTLHLVEIPKLLIFLIFTDIFPLRAPIRARRILLMLTLNHIHEHVYVHVWHCIYRTHFAPPME